MSCNDYPIPYVALLSPYFSKSMLSDFCLPLPSAVITGLVRTITGYRPGSYEPDFSNAVLWTDLHLGMSFVCACLPVASATLARMPVARYLSRLFPSLRSGAFSRAGTTTGSIRGKSSTLTNSSTLGSRHGAITPAPVVDKIPLVAVERVGSTLEGRTLRDEYDSHDEDGELGMIPEQPSKPQLVLLGGEAV